MGGAFRDDDKAAAGALPYLQHDQHHGSVAMETRLGYGRSRQVFPAWMKLEYHEERISTNKEEVIICLMDLDEEEASGATLVEVWVLVSVVPPLPGPM